MLGGDIIDTAHIQAALYGGHRVRTCRLCAALARRRTQSEGWNAPRHQQMKLVGKVGYEDAAFFRRPFKHVTGMTPDAYRRRSQVPDFARSRGD